MAGWRLDDVITREHILKMVARQRGLNFSPGAEYLYSNTGYTLLAEVVARVSGKTFRAFAEERIFTPLGMTHTHVHDDHEELVPGRAYSYAPRDGGFRASVLSYANAGATSLFTTAHDLSLWLRNFESGLVGGAEGIASLQQRGVLTSGDSIDYALGVAHGRYRGARTIAHAGSDAGFRSFVLWLPEHRVGVAVLANVSTFDVARAVLDVADVLLGDRLERPADGGVAPVPTLAAEAADAAAPRMDVTEEALAEFPGVYELEMGGVVAIERRGRGLSARLPDGEESTLVALSPSELRAASSGALLAFTRVPGSRASGFTARVGSAVYEAKRIQPIPASSLGELAGEYWSDELATGYRIVLEGERLLARHQRHPDVTLYPLSPDSLAGDAWFFARVTVVRGDAGSVSGILVSGGRTRNLRFDRR
jgi:hypothetical protein